MRVKAPQLREMTDDELLQKKNSIKQELFNLKHQVRLGRVEKPHRIQEARKEVARIETVLIERKKER